MWDSDYPPAFEVGIFDCCHSCCLYAARIEVARQSADEAEGTVGGLQAVRRRDLTCLLKYTCSARGHTTYPRGPERLNEVMDK